MTVNVISPIPGLGIDKTLKPFMDEIEIRFGKYLKILKQYYDKCHELMHSFQYSNTFTLIIRVFNFSLFMITCSHKLSPYVSSLLSLII